MIPELVATDSPAPGVRDAILKALIEFNDRHIGRPNDLRLLVVPVHDAQSGEATGGLWGNTARGWLSIELLFVPAGLRGRGLGSALLRVAEAEAMGRGCVGARVDTFSFQARGFYERLGYRVFGELAGFPLGHSCFYLAKRLDLQARSARLDRHGFGG